MTKLHNRLLTAMTALAGGAVLLTGLTVYFVVQSALQRNLDNSLVGLARTELASATDTGFVHVHEPFPQSLTISGAPGYEKFVWIVDNQDKMIAKTSNVVVPSVFAGVKRFEDLSRTSGTTFGDITINGQPVRAVFYPFSDPQGQAVIGVVGVPENVITDVVNRIGQVIILIGFSCLALTLGVVVTLAKSLSDPLIDLATAAEKIDLSKPESAVPLQAPYEEINGVALSINRLVGRVAGMLTERNRTIKGQRQLIADASHELRTPVSNIQGTIEVTLRHERTALEYQESLQTALGEAKRMGRLVDDLLSLAKSDLGQFQICPVLTDLVELVRGSARLLEITADPRFSLTFEAPESLMMKLDPDRCRQALDNLFRNAAIHARSRVNVRVKTVGQTVLVEVGNDGPELAEDEASLIFDRFYRTDDSRSRDTGGSGLGLSIVREIAEGHGGSASVSCSNGWTFFTLTLPISSVNK